MRTQHDQPETTARPREASEPWLWSVVNERGVEVDCGRTSDQASAIRHARRSALQRQGDMTIKVTHRRASPSGALRGPDA